ERLLPGAVPAEVPAARAVTRPAWRSTARCWEIAGLLRENAAAICPAGASRSQMRARISRRVGETNAEIIFWISRDAPAGGRGGCGGRGGMVGVGSARG